jgi:hypothetical protein
MEIVLFFVLAAACGKFLGRMAYLAGPGLGLLSDAVGLLRSCVEYQDVIIFSLCW